MFSKSDIFVSMKLHYIYQFLQVYFLNNGCPEQQSFPSDQELHYT